uniref:Uncharacterized protein n=1 Tax=Lepeophtheirus salmonis TaxID=72036 RepID=A0A0K2UKY7_LEPSM
MRFIFLADNVDVVHSRSSPIFRKISNLLRSESLFM